MFKRTDKGFTLIELLVVIAIIGIIAVVAVPILFDNINKAKISKLESSYNAIKSATLSYYSDKNDLPSSLEDLKKDGYIEGAFDSTSQSQTGGIYKFYKKDSSGKILSDTKEVESYVMKKDGTIDSSKKIKLQNRGELFLAIQGDNANGSMFITEKQLKKLCEDIGYENIYIFSSSLASKYKYNELYIRIIENI